MKTQPFDFDAGALCLDFANTVDWHASDNPQDMLHDYDGLIAWAVLAGILAPDQVDRLRRLAQEQPERAQAAFARASGLREAIYRLFVQFSEQGTFASEDLALINEALHEALANLKLVPSPAGFDWDWVETPAAFGQILWPIVRSTGDLLTSDQLERVRQCADDRGCGYLFVDMSRNRSRRWCSMESCGNRAKARRHYQRQQETE